MADTPELLRNIESARLTLLFNLVRLLMRERAVANDQTAADVMQHAEEIKTLFEARMQPEAAAHLTKAVDDFFNVLASDVATLRGNQQG